MFPGIEKEVVTMVLSECDNVVDEAVEQLETLMQLHQKQEATTKTERQTHNDAELARQLATKLESEERRSREALQR